MFSSSFSRALVIGLLLPMIPVQVGAEITAQTDAPLEELPTSTLIYVSDYFSFVGQDSQGHVALALDNNRGRDGEAYQAEHFVVLHDERRGWMNAVGNGPYENGSKELKAIPDSPVFRFQGTPLTGITIIANRMSSRSASTPSHNGSVTDTTARQPGWVLRPPS
jgi:hypothetical protein